MKNKKPSNASSIPVRPLAKNQRQDPAHIMLDVDRMTPLLPKTATTLTPARGAADGPDMLAAL